MNSTLGFPTTVATAVIAAVVLSGSESGAIEYDKLFDPDDGYLDFSEILDEPYGFFPLIIPITEPAVGYGGVFAPVFIQSNDTDDGETRRPNIFGAGGLLTENGSEGLFGFHSGSWKDDSIHSMVAAFDVSMNLDFYGAGLPSSLDTVPLSYTMEATGLMLEGNARLGDSDWWLGAGFSYSDVNALYRGSPVSGFTPPSFRTNIGTLSLLARHEVLNNFFTPTAGHRWDLKINLSDPVFGADGSWQSAELKGIQYWALDRKELWTFGLKARANASFGDAPFYLNPSIELRGVPAIRYQGETVADLEAELRYQFHPRFSALVFGGGGLAWQDDKLFGDSSESVIAGGLGFRYLVAKRHGMHIGMDFGYSPDNGVAIYFQFGSAWLGF